jgi:hypothetical protein
MLVAVRRLAAHRSSNVGRVRRMTHMDFPDPADSRYTLPMVGAVVHRQPSGVLPLEWLLQALVAAYNAVPVLLLAVLVGYVGFVVGIVTGVFGWVVGGVIAALIFGYALFCLIIAGGLWRRRGWARLAAIPVFLFYLLCVGRLVEAVGSFATAGRPPQWPGRPLLSTRVGNTSPELFTGKLEFTPFGERSCNLTFGSAVEAILVICKAESLIPVAAASPFERLPPFRCSSWTPPNWILVFPPRLTENQGQTGRLQAVATPLRPDVGAERPRGFLT